VSSNLLDGKGEQTGGQKMKTFDLDNLGRVKETFCGPDVHELWTVFESEKIEAGF